MNLDLEREKLELRNLKATHIADKRALESDFADLRVRHEKLLEIVDKITSRVFEKESKRIAVAEDREKKDPSESITAEDGDDIPEEGDKTTRVGSTSADLTGLKITNGYKVNIDGIHTFDRRKAK